MSASRAGCRNLSSKFKCLGLKYSSPWQNPRQGIPEHVCCSSTVLSLSPGCLHYSLTLPCFSHPELCGSCDTFGINSITTLKMVQNPTYGKLLWWGGGAALNSISLVPCALPQGAHSWPVLVFIAFFSLLGHGYQAQLWEISQHFWSLASLV